MHQENKIKNTNWHAIPEYHEIMDFSKRWTDTKTSSFRLWLKTEISGFLHLKKMLIGCLLISRPVCKVTYATLAQDSWLLSLRSTDGKISKFGLDIWSRVSKVANATRLCLMTLESGILKKTSTITISPFIHKKQICCFKISLIMRIM